MESKESKFIVFFKSYWPFLAYFLISVILLFPVLRQVGIPFKYDWVWPIFDLRSFWQQLSASNSFGLFAAFGKYPIAILGLLPVSPSLGIKFFLIVIHTLAGCGFYLFISKRVDNKLIAFVAGLAYAFSPYIFIREVVGFIYSLIAYACLPFFANLYFSSLKKGIWQYLLLAILFSFVTSQIQAGILLVLLLLVNVFIPFSRRRAFSKIGKLLIIAALTVAINIPWIIFVIFQKSTSIISSAGQVTTLSYIANMPHSLRNVLMLSDHIITREFFYPLAREPIVVISYLVVYLVAAFSLLDRKNRELVLTLIISSLLIIPFTIGPTGIFASFYTFVFNHFPQITIFRETYHFQFLLAFSLIVLFSIGLGIIWQKLVNYHLRFILLLTLAAMLITISAPYFTVDWAGYFHLQKIPNDYSNLNSFLENNKNYCHKIYYPPGTGFLFFRDSQTPDASNSDVLANSLKVPYLSEDISVLNLPNEEIFYRNEVVSQFYEGQDNGEFINLLEEGDIDCVMVRADIESKYFEVSNLWREKDSKVYEKWVNPDMLALAKSKQGLVLDKQFGDNIYIFKISNQIASSAIAGEAIPNPNIQKEISNGASAANKAIYLPISDWANQYDYYKDGWGRGRYAFWRKHLFTQLRQDFIYTDKQDSHLTAKIEQKGSYEVWIRYLTGGTSGNFQLSISSTSAETGNFQTIIVKDPREEKFVWKKLGDVDITDGKIEIINISGENAIADIVLISR